MPGIVGLFGLLTLGVFWIGSTFVVAAVLSLIFKRSRSTSFLIGMAVSGLVSFAMAWAAFGFQSHDIEPDDVMSKFPELVAFHASAKKGHYWQDGLSDGEYYVFELPPIEIKRLSGVLSAERYEWSSAEIAGRPLLSAPDWYVGKTCERHFGSVNGRASNGPYLERFTLHLCVSQNRLYADWERI